MLVGCAAALPGVPCKLHWPGASTPQSCSGCQQPASTLLALCSLTPAPSLPHSLTHSPLLSPVQCPAYAPTPVYEERLSTKGRLPRVERTASDVARHSLRPYSWWVLYCTEPS